MSLTPNNAFFDLLKKISSDSAKSQVHMHFSSLKREVEEKYNNDKKSIKKRSDNKILKLKSPYKLTESFNEDDKNIKLLLTNLEESKKESQRNINNKSKENSISLHLISNESSSYFESREILSNNENKSNKNEIVVEMFYSSNSFIEDDNKNKKKLSFYEKQMHRQKYVKSELKKLRNNEKLKKLSEFRNKPLINAHSEELINNKFHENYKPIFNRAKEIQNLKDAKLNLEQKKIEKELNKKKKSFSQNELNNFIQFQSDWKHKIELEKKTKTLYKTFELENKILKNTENRIYTNKKSEDLIKSNLIKGKGNLKKNIFQKLYKDYEKQYNDMKILENKYNANFTPFILNYIKPKHPKAKTMTISLDISLIEPKKKININLLNNTTIKKKKENKIFFYEEFKKQNSKENENNKNNGNKNIKPKSQIEKNTKNTTTKKNVYITDKKSIERTDSLTNKILLKRSYEKYDQPSLNGEKSSDHVYNISSSNFSSNNNKDNCNKSFSNFKYLTPKMKIDSKNLKSFKRENENSFLKSIKETNSFLSLNYNFDNSENHFCDDMNDNSINNNSYVNKAMKKNREKKKINSTQNQVNKLYMINTGISTSTSMKPYIVSNKKNPFTNYFKKE